MLVGIGTDGHIEMSMVTIVACTVLGLHAYTDEFCHTSYSYFALYKYNYVLSIQVSQVCLMRTIALATR